MALAKQGSVQFSSVAQSCPTLWDPMNCSMPGLPVHHQLTSIVESVMPSSYLILCRPLHLLPPIPPSIRVFSSESALHMRWPKYRVVSKSRANTGSDIDEKRIPMNASSWLKDRRFVIRLTQEAQVQWSFQVASIFLLCLLISVKNLILRLFRDTWKWCLITVRSP